MYFFTSDTHLGDDKTLKVDMRPFKNAKTFDKFVIKTWNKQAKKGDTIFVVGDFVDCDGIGHTTWKKTLKYAKKLKADLVLIIGNNESRVIQYYFDNSFKAFVDFCKNKCGIKNVFTSLELKMLNQKFYLVHKPVDYKPNMLNLFGHIHRSGGLHKEIGINVGCNLNHFRLYSETDIANLLNMRKKFWLLDENLKIN